MTQSFLYSLLQGSGSWPSGTWVLSRGQPIKSGSLRAGISDFFLPTAWATLRKHQTVPALFLAGQLEEFASTTQQVGPWLLGVRLREVLGTKGQGKGKNSSTVEEEHKKTVVGLTKNCLLLCDSLWKLFTRPTTAKGWVCISTG